MIFYDDIAMSVEFLNQKSVLYGDNFHLESNL